VAAFRALVHHDAGAPTRALAELLAAIATTSTDPDVVRYRRAQEPQGQIACGPWGCRRIPPNCRIQGTVLDWHGNPTGIDDVRCR